MCLERGFLNTTLETHRGFWSQVAEAGGAKWFDRDACASLLHITPPLQCTILFFLLSECLKSCHRHTAQHEEGSQRISARPLCNQPGGAFAESFGRYAL